ncbi:MAG TPA: hypothetical protein V6D20_25345 [Candidatus Obscuribacterales bacterium]
MTDLSKLKPEKDTVEVLIKHPITDEDLLNDDGTQMTITVYLPHSKEFKEASYEVQNRRLKAVQKNRGKVDLDAEKLDREALELEAKTIAAWDITYGGKKPKLSLEAAKEVLSDLPWLRDQIAEAVANAQVFTKV